MTFKATLANRYLTVCNETLGWNAAVDGDDDIRFEVDGMVAYVQPDGSDPAYLRMRAGVDIGSYVADQAGLSWADPNVIARLDRIASKLTVEIKCAKVAILPERQAVYHSVEMLVAAPDCMPDTARLAAVLPRARRMLASAVREFREELTLYLIESVTDSASTREP